MAKYFSAADAVKLIKSGDRVFIHSAACAPQQLIKAMVNRSSELRNVEIVQIHTEGPAPYADPEYVESFKVNAFFVGKNIRKAVQEGRANYTPLFLSEIPLLFINKVLPLDVALIQVTPPDKHGMCSIGPSVDVSISAIKNAKRIIAQVNPQLPRCHGDGIIRFDTIDAAVEVNEPIFSHEPGDISDDEMKIGRHVASLIEDGSTLQMGIGSIPNAVLSCLTNHERLGIHSEMFTDGVVDLVKKGVITGEEKAKFPNKVVSSFCMGTQKTYDFVNDNSSVMLLPALYVNDTRNIRVQPKMCAINSAIEVDITGQVCADSIGTLLYSGVGGQVDFIRGASLSKGGKPIIALPSITSKGESRITTFLKQGAGVVTTRAHVHYIVTEYGIAYLYGKNLRERAKELIKVAHPNHRERLEREMFELYGKF